jgi:hypothetical protein
MSIPAARRDGFDLFSTLLDARAPHPSRSGKYTIDAGFSKRPASGCGLGLVEVAMDGFGGFAGDDRGEGFGGGLLDVAEAAEVGEETLAGLRAYSGDGK